MPTLIELNEDESRDLRATHVVEVPVPERGEKHPEFILRPGQSDWDWNGNFGQVSCGAYVKGGAYRFARRATQSEIDATRSEASPSVGRDHLHPQVRQLLEQLRGAVNHFPDGQWTLHETESAVHELCHLLLDFGDGYLVKQSVGRDELVELLCGALEASLDLWDMGQEANSSLTQMDRYQELDRRKDQIVERARAALAAAGKGE